MGVINATEARGRKVMSQSLLEDLVGGIGGVARVSGVPEVGGTSGRPRATRRARARRA